MNVTQSEVVGKLLGYVNGELTLGDLVSWAEAALVTLVECESDVRDEDVLFRVLGYIAAGDTAGFPLTWEVLAQFLRELDTTVRVVITAA